MFLLGWSLHTWENVMLVFLGVAALAAAIVGWSTYAVVQLQKQEASDAKKDLDEYKLTVESKVADAKTEGIEAGKAAGSALVRAEELRAANLALEVQIAPRRITEQQVVMIGTALSRFAGKTVSVISYSLDAEAAILSMQLMGSLRLGNITPQDLTASVLPMGGFSVGIHVTGSDTELVNALRVTLQSIGGLLVAPPQNSSTSSGASMGTEPQGQKEPDASVLVGVKPVTR